MNSLPPFFTSSSFNSTAFAGNRGITRQEADLLYLPMSSSTILGLLLSTPGVATASKALIFDASINITGINSLGATTLVLGGNSLGATESAYLTGITPGTATASKALVINSSRNIVNINELSTTAIIRTNFNNDTGFVLEYQRWTNSAATPLICILAMSNVSARFGLTTNQTLRFITNDIVRVNIENGGPMDVLGGLKISGTTVSSTAAELNYLFNSTPGTAVASKALVVDASRNIVNINSLTATSLTGTLQTAAQPNITSVGTLTSISTSGSFTMGSTVISEAEIGVLDGSTPGTAVASKALVIDSSRNIVNINSLTTTSLTVTTLTATNLAGTLTTAAQPNITSLGTLTGLRIVATTSNSLALESSSTNVITNSSNTGLFDLYIKRNTLSAGDTCGIGFLVTSNDPATTLPMCSILGIRVALSSGHLVFNTTGVERMRIESGGNISGISSLSTTTLVLGGNSLGATQSAYLTGITAGTALASKAMILDSSRNISNINSINSSTLLCTTLTVNQNLNPLITISSNNSTSINILRFTGTDESMSISFHNNNASVHPRMLTIFNGFDYLLTMSNIGVFTLLNDSNSTSSTTGALRITGGLGVAKALFVGGDTNVSGVLNITGTSNLLALCRIGTPATPASTSQVIIQSSGFDLQLQHSALYYTRMGVNGSGHLTLESNINSVITSNIFDGGNLGLSIFPRSAFDLGARLNNCLITLYQLNNLSPTYMIGVSNSSNIYVSGGSNGHMFYSNLTSGVGAPQALGTLTMQNKANGTLQTLGNIISNTGIHAFGNSNTDLTGAIASMDINAGDARYYGYNYSTSLFIRSVLGNNNVYINTNGTTSIGTSSSTYILEVGSNTQNLTGGYGYITSGASTGTGSSTGNVSFSARFSARIAVGGEVDIYSDRRIKEDIRSVTEEEANNFVNKCDPKFYKLKNKNDRAYGYIAQDLLKTGNGKLVQMHMTEIPGTVDDDGFINPKDIIFTIAYQKVCVLLHKKILMMDEQIQKNNSLINDLLTIVANIKDNKLK